MFDCNLSAQHVTNKANELYFHGFLLHGVVNCFLAYLYIYILGGAQICGKNGTYCYREKVFFYRSLNIILEMRDFHLLQFYFLSNSP